MLDQLESGPWPSFVTGLKRLAKDNDMMVDLLGQLEHSYKTRKGYWKGGTVGVFGYGGGVIPRFTELKDENDKPLFPEAAEFHTLRVHAAGRHALHHRHAAQDVRHLGEARLRPDRLPRPVRRHHVPGRAPPRTCSRPSTRSTSCGFDLGGAGPACAPSMSCVGAARCEQSCYDEGKAHRTVINNFLDDMHRPALPYKFKFKFSGCPNDCMNSIQRADMAVIGTWRDNIRTDEALARKWFAKHGMNELVNDVVARCPTKAIQLKEIQDVSPRDQCPRWRSTTRTRSRSTTATACAACTASTS